MLPVQQEAQEIGRADRLDLRPQAIQRVAMDAGEQPPVAPLELGNPGSEAAAQDATLRLQRLQGDVRVRHIELALGHRPEDLEAARDQLERLIIDALERKPRLAALDSSSSKGSQQRWPVRRQLRLL